MRAQAGDELTVKGRRSLPTSAPGDHRAPPTGALSRVMLDLGAGRGKEHALVTVPPADEV